ncbi:MAG: M18 family aminopeptidase [Bacteroidales bacterium]|nr:M18 family aminopeptidase [Bacteroidales bacterium]
MEQKYIDESKRLINFIHQSPSPFHVIENMAQMLKDKGFEELCLKKSWNLMPGGKYYARRNGTALIAFTVNQDADTKGLRIIAAHSDAPTFRIKPNPEMMVDRHMVKLNTETYGGAILHTWMDRPLSIAGRVIVRSENPMHPTKRLFDFEKPVGIIPSLAIHMNRGVNEGLELNKQTDMPVLIKAIDEVLPPEATLNKAIAEKLNINKADILDYDLYLYDTTPGTIVGIDDSMVLAPKLDDLSMAYAAICSMCDSADNSTNKIVCIFDNEEVGSGTKQGAKSPLLKNIIERIAEKLGYTDEQRQMMTYNSFMISADQAHAVHPNLPSKHDPVLHPVINGGPVIKVAANQKYMTDADSSAIFMELCRNAGVPFQKFANRSDNAGGSTLGNLLTSQIDIHGVDMGNPMIGMHSSHETTGVKDQTYARNVFTHFLNT